MRKGLSSQVTQLSRRATPGAANRLPPVPARLPGTGAEGGAEKNSEAAGKLKKPSNSLVIPSYQCSQD